MQKFHLITEDFISLLSLDSEGTAVRGKSLQNFFVYHKGKGRPTHIKNKLTKTDPNYRMGFSPGKGQPTHESRLIKAKSDLHKSLQPRSFEAWKP
jgi:hypothetical protein